MDILRYEDAKWNISGLFSHDAIILKFYDILSSFNLYPISGVHGAPPCKWNSGRTVIGHSYNYINDCIKEYKNRNVPIFLTFSNYLLSEEDLCDDYSNMLLDAISKNPCNGVIISSPILKEYITKKYPKIIQIMSVLTSVKETMSRDKMFYESKIDYFDRIVIHPDDLNDNFLLESLQPKSNFEIMVNENCIQNCPYRKQHDDLICEYSMGSGKVDFQALDSFSKKHCKMFLNQNNLKEYLCDTYVTCNLSYNRLNDIYDKGYRHYKIQGRADSPASFLYDISRYVLSRDAEPLIFKHICNSISFSHIMDRLELL